MAKKMKPDEAAWLLAQIIVNDPSDVRIGWATEEDARQAAIALEALTRDRWLVSAYRPRQHTSKQTYFCYRVTKTTGQIHANAPDFEDHD